MNQEEIEAFLAVLECGSISAAAESLHVTQPTLSARLRTLEGKLDARLFDRARGQKDTVPTQAGRQLEASAREWLRLCGTMQETVKHARQRALSITASHTINAYVFPDVYRTLSSESRRCSFRFLSNHYYESYRLVENGEADAGLVSNVQYSRSVRAIPLFREDMVLLSGKNSNFPSIADPRSLDVLHEVHLDWDENYNRWYRYWFGAAVGSLVQSSDITFVREFVQMDSNWAIVPLTVARKLCQTGELRFCCLSDKPVPRTTALLSRSDPAEYPVLTDFLMKLRDVIEAAGAEWIADK